MFEFKNPTNSFKPWLSGIVSRSFPNFEEDVDSLVWSQPGTKKGVRAVGFLKAVEYPDHFLRVFLSYRAECEPGFGFVPGA